MNHYNYMKKKKKHYNGIPPRILARKGTEAEGDGGVGEEGFRFTQATKTWKN